MTKVGEKDRHFLLVYGSQTGQAKAIAEEFQQTTADKGLSPALFCFSQFEKKVDVLNLLIIPIVGYMYCDLLSNVAH